MNFNASKTVVCYIYYRLVCPILWVHVCSRKSGETGRILITTYSGRFRAALGDLEQAAYSRPASYDVISPALLQAKVCRL